MSLIGFDIGNNSCATAVTKPRTIQNLQEDEANYETPSLISFAEKKRHFGSYAASLSTYNPSSTLSQIKRLVGKEYGAIRSELDELPFTTSKADDGGIMNEVGHCGSTRKFTVVQILAMLMSYLKKGAEKNLGVPVTNCVIGIPSYFSDRERFAYLDVAEIAGLKPLKLMHEGTAIALGYGIYNQNYKGNVVFVDVGHCATQHSDAIPKRISDKNNHEEAVRQLRRQIYRYLNDPKLSSKAKNEIERGKNAEKWADDSVKYSSSEIYVKKANLIKTHRYNFELAQEIRNAKVARAQAIGNLLYCIFQNRVKGIYYEACKDKINSECEKAEDWLAEKTNHQNSLPKSDNPLEKDINTKADYLNSSCQFILQECQRSLRAQATEKRNELKRNFLSFDEEYYVMYKNFCTELEKTEVASLIQKINKLLSEGGADISAVLYTKAMEELNMHSDAIQKRISDKNNHEEAVRQLRRQIYRYLNDPKLSSKAKNEIERGKNAEKWADDSVKYSSSEIYVKKANLIKTREYFLECYP